MSKAAQRRRSAQQARARSARPVDLTILAIKHYPDSGPEFVFFRAQRSSVPVNSKDRLLSHICLRDWLHQAPADAIAEYLIQTKSYQMFSRFDRDCGYIINFYESDPDRPDTHSCREITAAPREAIREQARLLAQELSQDQAYSVNVRDAL